MQPSSPGVPITLSMSLGKAHARRLRDIYRSAGWPSQDPVEIELLAAGMLDRVQAPSGHESLRVTSAGVQMLAAALAGNRASFSAHEALVEQVALGDLRNDLKRTAYLHLGECWYVLGCDAKGRCIAQPEEVPSECGVLVLQQNRFVVARPAPRRARATLPFGVWMALARATPVPGLDDQTQALLG